ncbi:purine-cytosine permease family protein [Cellulomonas marina]|uniref:Purine-cytosine permease n=1 Tax=Cellulomonas marina TaxID=988821 RepID=A0A1I0YAY6_9CELL|nr:cytosine permease [Cellulomonas marina]GIG29622.1 allantoin permease [Cellulomonas marina]SFB10352.1 Purine-cytosine permease [Cellulomonas marina]
MTAAAGPSGPSGATAANPSGGALQVESHGIDVIADADRKGRPRDLFWPWFAANVSVLGLSYGAWVLDFGISFGQATAAAVVGILFSFVLCGLVSLAGKRGSAPTMVLSRAALGVRGNRVASGLSWLLTVGWETVLVSLATLATGTVLGRLGWGGGTTTQVVALLVVAGLVVAGGVFGFDLIMRLQTVITVVTAVLTVGYVLLVLDEVDLDAVAAVPAGSGQAFVGALVFMMTGFGLGWVNMAADYSRYLPRTSSSRGVVGWTTVGASLAPLLLVGFGLLLAASDDELRAAISADPVGALTTVLPPWYLLPFAVVAVLGLVGGAVLDLYSSGLALVATGLPVKRPVAAGIDGVVMVLGTIYVVFGSDEFFGVFQGFLITLGVPIAAWCGIFLADIALRRRPYAERDLFTPAGRYGDVVGPTLAVLAVASFLGWGLVVNTYAGWLAWQGYLLGPLGGREGAWAFANLGVLVALAVGFVATLVLRAGAVRRQESLPAEAAVPAREVEASLQPDGRL